MREWGWDECKEVWGRFGSCRISAVSYDKAMEMKNGKRMGKTADTLVDEGVDKPLVFDDEKHYLQEEGVVTALASHQLVQA